MDIDMKKKKRTRNGQSEPSEPIKKKRRVEKQNGARGAKIKTESLDISSEISLVESKIQTKLFCGYEKLDKDCWSLVFDMMVTNTAVDTDTDTDNADDDYREEDYASLDKDSRFQALTNLSLVSTFFKDFVKIFYWDELANRNGCLYMFHKLSVPMGAFSSQNKNGRNLKIFRVPLNVRKQQRAELLPSSVTESAFTGISKRRLNKKLVLQKKADESQNHRLVDLEKGRKTMDFDPIFTKTPHYFCKKCKNVVQCAHCVHKKDYLFTTTKDLNHITKYGNTTKNNRFKKHPNRTYMACFYCKSEATVVKRYLNSTVDNKFVFN